MNYSSITCFHSSFKFSLWTESEDAAVFRVFADSLN